MSLKFYFKQLSPKPR